MANETQKETSWGDDVSKVIESLGRGLGSILNPGGSRTTAPTTPIVVTQPTKSNSGFLVVGLVAVVAIGGLVFYLSRKK